MIRKLLAVLIFAGAPVIALGHYYFLRPIVNPVSTTSTATGTPSAPITITQWRCVTSAGVTIPNAGPFSTKAAAEAPCGVAVATDGVTRFLEEAVITTTTVPTTTTVRTRREEVLGGTTLKVSDVHAQAIMAIIAGSGSGDPGGATYSVDDAIAGAPFVITKPTLPTTTSQVTVNTSTLAANIDGVEDNGKELTLGSGSYGDITISRSDQAWILQTGATIGTLSVSGADDFSIRCESVRACTVGQIDITNSTDVSVYGVAITDTASAAYNWIAGTTARVSFISSSVEMGSYAFYIDNNTADIIFGNSNIQTTGAGNQATMRLMGMERSVVRDSRLAQGGSNSNYRVHANDTESSSEDHWFEGNQVEGSPGQIQPDSTGGGSSQTLDNVTVDNSTWYVGGPTGNFGSMGDPGQRASNLRMRGNTMYSTGGSFPSELEATWDISGNVVNDTATAPAWSFAP